MPALSASVDPARTYDRLDDLVEDVENARVWGGLHYRTTMEETAKHSRASQGCRKAPLPVAPHPGTRRSDGETSTEGGTRPPSVGETSRHGKSVTPLDRTATSIESATARSRSSYQGNGGTLSDRC